MKLTILIILTLLLLPTTIALSSDLTNPPYSVLGKQKVIVAISEIGSCGAPDISDKEIIGLIAELNTITQKSSFGKATITGIDGKSFDAKSIFRENDQAIPIEAEHYCTGNDRGQSCNPDNHACTVQCSPRYQPGLVGKQIIEKIDNDITFTPNTFYRLIALIGREQATCGSRSEIRARDTQTKEGTIQLSKTVVSLSDSTRRSTYPTNHRRTLLHEYGHGLGFKHDGYLACAQLSDDLQNCDLIAGDTGDTLSALGASVGAYERAPDAPDRIQAGWLTLKTEHKYTIVPEMLEEKQTYTLQARNHPSPGLKAIAIPYDGETYISVEYINPQNTDDIDNSLIKFEEEFHYGSDFFSGAILRYAHSSYHPDLLLRNNDRLFDPLVRVPLTDNEILTRRKALNVRLTPTLPPGKHYTLPTTGQTIYVKERTDQSLTVEIYPKGELPTDYSFTRGDVNRDGQIDISDPVDLLAYLFQGGQTPTCHDAADANDDGALDLSDAVAILDTLFNRGDNLPTPYPAPGIDPTADSLNCAA